MENREPQRLDSPVNPVLSYLARVPSRERGHTRPMDRC